jgi:2-polyprenyl-6-methoxyphenol 4-hydroxylase
VRAHYDIVIAGGGMVGASLALALARALDERLQILVVESFALPEPGQQGSYQPSFDARSTALAAGSRRIYENIGVWEALAANISAIDSIHVSTRGRPGSTLMQAADEALEALGYVVENQWLGRVLLEQLQCCRRLQWLAPATLRSVRMAGNGGSRVEIDHGGSSSEVSCELLVIADGAHSALARSLGVTYTQTDYQHQAIIANVGTARPHGGRAFERFTDQGPMALLPLTPAAGKSRSALVWTMPTALAGATMQLDDSAFLAQLQQRFGYRLGAFARLGERHSYPLKLVEADEQVRTGVVIMGNAAHFLHPVAGQGFNLALRDVARLVEVLARARAEGRGLGELASLQAYQQAQLWDQRSTTLFSDRISDMFSWSQPLVAVARDISLSALDVVLPAKSWFLHQAAGLGGGAASWPREVP